MFDRVTGPIDDESMNTEPTTTTTDPDEYDEYDMVCECELDWRCGLHAGQYTPLELMNDDWAKQENDSAPWWAL